MYRKYLAFIVLVVYLACSTFIFKARDPVNTSWITFLVEPILYYMIFGMILSFLLGIKYKYKEDIFMIIMGCISLYIALIPIIYYSRVGVLNKLESFIMMNNMGIAINRMITILLGILIGGFINGVIKGSRSTTTVQDVR